MESKNHENFQCKCCGNYSLGEFPNGTFEICEICFWEDDNVQSDNPNFIVGANKISLNKAKENYSKFGISNPNLIENKIENNDFYPGMKVKLNDEYGIVTNEKNYDSYGIILWDTEKMNDLENWCGLFGSFRDSGGIIVDNKYEFKKYIMQITPADNIVLAKCGVKSTIERFVIFTRRCFSYCFFS
ncbi:MAG: hypothetical protein BGO40_03540 [Chryseobacterium sp. 39-10]|nr:CPCC family cysteine-rich protein [Flavobacterium sp.]MBP7319161.1 hypothetical protein [Flavobacterium sp.]OJV48986.1 MAG: hypothetical protein BGO40_03540 [Chryseobacterium sp. 39-10]